MDSTVIQEIANQLGMAVDQAGQFITEQLPGFATLKVLQLSVPLYVAAVASIILLVPWIIALYFTHKQRKSDAEGKSEYRYSNYEFSAGWSDYSPFWVFICFAAANLVAVIVLIALMAVNVPQIIGWQNYPEAMLIDMALKAV